MTNAHYDDDELSDHLLRPNAHVAKHVDTCGDCRGRLEVFQEIDRALRLPVVWQMADRLREHSGLSELLVARARSIDEEDSKACHLLSAALVSPGAFAEHEVAVRAQYRTPGVVRVLVREAKKTREVSPPFALLLASAALSIGAKLNRDAVSASVIGAAHLEQGIASAMIGAYRDAKTALSRAEEAFKERGGGTTWDLAVVWLSRANVCVETGDLEDALHHAASAADVFLAEHGDVPRYLRACLVRGTVLYVRGLYEQSIAVFGEMLAHAETIGDTVTCARALHNAANSYLARGDLDRAADHYLRALALWDELGSDAESARTRWSLATIDVARGKWKLGYEGLADAQRQLSALGLLNDEALVRIEMAEVLILLRRHSEVAPLLDGIVLQFANEGMTRNARLALASLREADRRRVPSRDELRHVREYLRRLPTSPAEPFRLLK